VKWKRTFFLIAVGGAVFACSGEEKKNQGLHPYSGPRDSGADVATVADAAPSEDTGAPIDAGIDTADAAPVTVFISDLGFTEVANGYGPVEKDMSLGDINAADGVTMSLAGVPYTKGLGVHAASQVDVNLGGQYKRFQASVGVDDEVGAAGSIVFRVVADGAEIFNSDVMTGDSDTKLVDVDVTGKTTLQLFVDDANDGIGSDHGDWANARLVK
jgi:hypothetical protein